MLFFFRLTLEVYSSNPPRAQNKREYQQEDVSELLALAALLIQYKYLPHKLRLFVKVTNQIFQQCEVEHQFI